ncbi:MAG: hypothetical protein MJ223_01025 [Mycoplasmoidaceae bacterium]|nr:hypothetical protein [Mycoplasmoidaceae bacterium]
METNKKKIFTSLQDLMNLNDVPPSKKKEYMEKNVKALQETVAVHRMAQAKLSTANQAFSKSTPPTSEESYKVRKKIYKELAEAENNMIDVQSKLSKYINSLLFDHNCASGKHNKMTIDELATIVNAYENKEFTDNFFPRRRLHQLKSNNSTLRSLQFDLEVAQQIKDGKFKLPGKFHLKPKSSKY